MRFGLGLAAGCLAAGALAAPAGAATSVSDNWAGYAVLASQSTGAYKRVSASWVVPRGSCDSPATYSAAWVGVGGYEDSSRAIDAAVSVTGTRVTLVLRNRTRHVTFRKTTTMSAPDTSSAEWIVEAPSDCDEAGNCRQLALSDFGTVAFRRAGATSTRGHTGGVAPGDSVVAGTDRDAGHVSPSLVSSRDREGSI